MTNSKSLKRSEKKTFEEFYNFNREAEYIDFNKIGQSTYYQVQKWLVTPKYRNINSDCKILYMIICEKCKQSYDIFKEGKYTGHFKYWDYDNNVPMVKIGNKELLNLVSINTTDTLKTKLDLLVELNLIERKRNFDNSVYFKVKIYKDEINKP